MKLADVEKALKEILQLIQDKKKIKKEIDALVIQREDLAMDVEKERKKSVKEVAAKKEQVTIEINTLTTQLDNLKGELKRLPRQIQSKKDSISALDEVIDGLKVQQAELNTENKRLEASIEGYKAQCKKFASKFVSA